MKILFQISNLFDKNLLFRYNYIIKGKNMINISKKDIQDYSGFLKRKMIMSRIMGVISCLIGITCLILYYFKVVNEWMCLIILTYCMANCFMLNSNLQGIKVGNPWQRVNAYCSIFFYLFVVFLISYGFASGNLAILF